MVFESTNSWPSFEGQEHEIPPPRSSYGFQKLAVEYFARAAQDQHRLPYTIVRPFNCVGIGEAARPRRRRGAERQRQAGHEPRGAGPGPEGAARPGPAAHPRRRHPGPPLHLRRRPRPRASSTAMEHPAALNEDFNLSTSASTTVLELARADLEADPRRASRPSATSRTRPFEHDVQRRVPSVEKARRVLGFEATTSLDADARRGHPVDRAGAGQRRHLTTAARARDAGERIVELPVVGRPGTPPSRRALGVAHRGSAGMGMR